MYNTHNCEYKAIIVHRNDEDDRPNPILISIISIY